LYVISCSVNNFHSNSSSFRLITVSVYLLVVECAFDDYLGLNGGAKLKKTLSRSHITLSYLELYHRN
jgi:hypothetical protein